MKKRILTGSLILIVYALFLFTRVYTPYAFDAFIGVIAVVGCVEVTRVLERKRMFTNIALIGSFPAILYIAMSIGIINERDWYYYLLYFVIIIFALFLINFLYTIFFTKATQKEKDKYGVFDSDAKYGFRKCMNSTFVMIYPALLFSTFFVINHYFDFAFVVNTGLESTDTMIVTMFFLLMVFVVTILTDTFALVVGRLFKGPKLCPKISPNKTISGAVGGLIFGSLGGIGLYYLFTTNTIFREVCAVYEISWWMILIFAIVMAIVCQIGDLIASALKRSARVKDYGTLFPGHGGVMDRVDGLICNALVAMITMFLLF